MKEWFYPFSMLILFCFGLGNLEAQSPFKGALFLGTNGAQINGDDLAGYHKWGLTGGVGVRYELNPKWDFGAELLYSQRGARNGLFPESGRNFYIKMDYAELPFLLYLKDWYVEKDKYYKVKAHTGFSLANLINSSTNIPIFDPRLDASRSRDVSFIIGVDYHFTRRWGLNVRYTRSLYPFFISDQPQVDDLLGYFLTLRAEYSL